MNAKNIGKKPRATNATREARIEAIVRIKLDGAEPWDVRQFVAVSEKAGEGPWKMGRGRKPLSDRQIRRYCALADQRIAESVRTLNPEAFRLHLARLNRLYFKAVQTGDLRTALSVLIDQAKMQGLYPTKKDNAEQSGKMEIKIVATDDFYGNADLDRMTDEEKRAELKRLDAILAEDGTTKGERFSA